MENRKTWEVPAAFWNLLLLISSLIALILLPPSAHAEGYAALYGGLSRASNTEIDASEEVPLFSSQNRKFNAKDVDISNSPLFGGKAGVWFLSRYPFDWGLELDGKGVKS